jgi:hypothetical protein
MDSVMATQPRQKARWQHNGDSNSNDGDDVGDGDNDGDGDKDNGDDDGWRDGDGRREGDTTATAAMGGATAHNW